LPSFPISGFAQENFRLLLKSTLKKQAEHKLYVRSLDESVGAIFPTDVGWTKIGNFQMAKSDGSPLLATIIELIEAIDRIWFCLAWR
jgi:hypothetical protein